MITSASGQDGDGFGTWVCLLHGSRDVERPSETALPWLYAPISYTYTPFLLYANLVSRIVTILYDNM